MQDLSKVIKDRIKNYDNIIRETETGYVIEVGDGIARIHGLDACMAGELIELCAQLLRLRRRSILPDLYQAVFNYVYGAEP